MTEALPAGLRRRAIPPLAAPPIEELLPFVQQENRCRQRERMRKYRAAHPGYNKIYSERYRERLALRRKA